MYGEFICDVKFDLDIEVKVTVDFNGLKLSNGPCQAYAMHYRLIGSHVWGIIGDVKFDLDIEVKVTVDFNGLKLSNGPFQA